MDRYIKRLVQDNSNDQELGAKVRAYVLNDRKCCGKKENKKMYVDGIGNKYPQCGKCGRLLI